VASNGGGFNTLQAGGHLPSGHLSGALQTSKGREHFRVEMSWNVEFTTAKSGFHRRRHR
jgi:hypothetical protein